MRFQHLLQRLKRLRTTASPPESVAAPVGDAPPRPPAAPLDRLEVQAAIIHHLEWCVLLNDHLSADEQPPSPITPLPEASHSELGRWLARMKGNHAGPVHEQLNALEVEHRRVHLLARQALALARQGRMDLASTLLNTDFERSRANVLQMLRQMQRR